MILAVVLATLLPDCQHWNIFELLVHLFWGVRSLALMQGQRRTIDSYPETVDFDQGAVTNSTGMDQQTSWNNMFNPAENRLPNFMQSSAESNFMCGNAGGHDVRSFSGWGSGEPSSSANPHHQVSSDRSKMEHAWSSSFSVRNGAGPRLEERRFEPTSEPLFLQNSSSDCLPQNVNRTKGYVGDGGNNGQGMDAGVSSNLGTTGGPETEQTSPANFSSGNVGSSSGISGFAQENDGGSTLGSWGSSCKRKALEGTSGSGQSYPGDSSSCFTQAENSLWHTVPARHSASSSLNISAPLGNSRTASTTEQLNRRIGVSLGEACDDFPPLTVTGNSESSLRNCDRRVNSGHQQEPLPFNSSSRGSSRHFNFLGPFQIPSSRPLPFTETLEPRSAAANIGASQSQSNIMHGPGSSRNGHTFPWNGASISRSGSSSSSINLSGDRGLALREDANLASMTRNSAEHSVFTHTNETRSIAQDPTNWSLATGNVSSPGVVPSTSRIGASSSVHPLTPSWPSWIPHPNPQTHNQQRLSGFSPWTLFPSFDSEPGGQNANFPPLSSGASASSQETMTSSGPSSHSHRQAHVRPAFSMERQGDDVLGMPHSLRALAADIEGRHRLISEIRQVLGAMRRGENLRVEDYMLFDPLIFHGLPEIHDRHRDMRLDVDSMSYEELLALGERIGDVKTGLSEETILNLMKQRKYTYISIRNPKDMEPCCVCQEEYVGGDDLGTLECGHDFHTNCITQWLMLKNLCPICKTTGLIT